jgi:hypothetical protein
LGTKVLKGCLDSSLSLWERVRVRANLLKGRELLTPALSQGEREKSVPFA